MLVCVHVCVCVQELNDATFKPDLKTPCVCGKGKGLKDSSALEAAKHTYVCARSLWAPGCAPACSVRVSGALFVSAFP